MLTQFSHDFGEKYKRKREVLYTPLKYLSTPHLLSKPQNILFASHSNTLLSQRTLLTSHIQSLLTPHSPKTHPLQSSPKTHNPPQIREPPNNNKFGDSTQDQKYQVSLLHYLICCVYSCIFIVKYGFIVFFFFEISSGFLYMFPNFMFPDSQFRI